MRNLVLPLLVAASACSPASAVPPSLVGKWSVTAIDGKPPLVGIEPDSAAWLSFDSNGYGGNVGCNGFGGIGVEHDGRWFAGFATSTAMSCGDALNAQEALVQRVMGSGPAIAWRTPDALTFAAPGHRVELRRAGPLPPGREPIEPPPMIGTRWSFAALDGTAMRLPGAASGPVLTVEGDRFRFETPCAVQQGRWRQDGAGAVTLTPETERATPCAASARTQSVAWAKAMQGPLRYATGPNGEIVIAGGGHWMVGDSARRGSGDTRLVEGRWQVEGAAEASGGEARPPELIIAGGAYYLWDGCNHREGLAILHERTLHSHGSGMTTLANCAPGRAHQAIKAVVASAPVIGLTEGGMRLVSSAGELRLRRVGAAPGPSGGVTRRLAAGMRFRLLDLGGGWLDMLPAGRFRLTQACGTTEGQWRTARGEVDGALRFGPERTPDGCMAPGEGRRLNQIFTGNLDLAIGPNKDIALFAGRLGAVRARLERSPR